MLQVTPHSIKPADSIAMQCIVNGITQEHQLQTKWPTEAEVTSPQVESMPFFSQH